MPFAITVLMLLVAYLVSWGIGLLRNMIMMKMGLEIVVDLRTKLYDKVQLMSIERVSNENDRRADEPYIGRYLYGAEFCQLMDSEFSWAGAFASAGRGNINMV